MPNSLSAKKRLRQDAVKRDRNRAIKSVIRKRIRAVREAVEAGDIEAANAGFILAAKNLDRAGARNVIHRNAASRTKSRLQKMIKKAKDAAA